MPELKDGNVKNPRYIRAYIKNAFTFYKDFLSAVVAEYREHNELEIIQKDLFNYLEKKLGKKLGESTVIKYVTELERWGFLKVELKKRNNRFAKHLKPTARGIILTKLYDPDWKVSVVLQSFTEEYVPTIGVLFKNNTWLYEYNNMLANPTVLDLCTILKACLVLSGTVFLGKLANQKVVMDLQTLNEFFEMIRKKRPSEVTLAEYITYFFPVNSFDKFIKTIEKGNDLTYFLAKINLYLISLIYFTLKVNSKDLYRYGNKYCVEFNSIVYSFRLMLNVQLTLPPFPCEIQESDTFFLPIRENKLRQISNILGITDDVVEDEATRLYLIHKEFEIAEERNKILQKYSVGSLLELRNKISHSKQQYNKEMLEDINKLQELEDKLAKIRALKENMAT